MIEEFNEIIDMPYSEFLDDLKRDDTSGERYDLLLLAQSSMENSFEAIKLSFNRVEGLQETPIEFDVPSFYIRYVNAESVEGGISGVAVEELEEKEDSYDPTTAKLRETLRKMRKMPKQVPDMIMKVKGALDDGDDVGDKIPTVKMIICANLIILSRKKPKIVTFVFDQIYGKLAHKVKIMNGEDIYVDNYTQKVAPVGAFQDSNGVWVAEDLGMKAAFISGFARLGGKYSGLLGDDDEL